MKPDFAEAYLNLGDLLKGEGEVEEAIASYRKANEVKPDFGDAYVSLAELYALHSFSSKAQGCLRMVQNFRDLSDVNLPLIVASMLLEDSFDIAKINHLVDLEIKRLPFLQCLVAVDFEIKKIIESLEFVDQFQLSDIHQVLKDFMRIVRHYPQLKQLYDKFFAHSYKIYGIQALDSTVGDFVGLPASWKRLSAFRLC